MVIETGRPVAEVARSLGARVWHLGFCNLTGRIAERSAASRVRLIMALLDGLFAGGGLAGRQRSWVSRSRLSAVTQTSAIFPAVTR
jgi:hypothetical protein